MPPVSTISYSSDLAHKDSPTPYTPEQQVTTEDSSDDEEVTTLMYRICQEFHLSMI